MPVIDARCDRCEVTEEELVPTLSASPPACPRCGYLRRKVFSVPTVKIPAWMTDSGIASNARHREWLKTPEAKALSLDRAGDSE